MRGGDGVVILGRKQAVLPQRNFFFISFFLHFLTAVCKQIITISNYVMYTICRVGGEGKHRAWRDREQRQAGRQTNCQIDRQTEDQRKTDKGRGCYVVYLIVWW